MRRHLGGLAALAVAAAACGLTSSPPTIGTAVVPSVAPEALAPPPDGVAWTRQAGGVEIYGLTPQADPAEVELIGAAVAELHPAVIEASGLRFLVRSAEPAEGELDVGGAVAFAVGPDVWLVDTTFAEVTEPAGRLGTARVLAHELAHTAQFSRLDDDAIVAAGGGEIDMASGSLLVADYAIAVGWQRDEDGSWRLEERAGTTDYGLTGPEEDMAESLSLITLGRANALSPDRVGWLEQWLGVSAAELAEGKPWFPDGAEQFLSEMAIFDEELVAARNRDHVEPTYLLLKPDSHSAERLADEVGRELRARRFTGTLERADDPRLPRFQGQFVRRDGVILWVEVWDFREGPGFIGDVPDGPVLSYVLLW